MKKILLLAFIIVSCQSQPKESTTFILVRHAEKAVDGTKDPTLTIEGENRAQRLASLLDKTNITRIYSTEYKRTQLTVQPLATNIGLGLESYDWKDPEAFLNSIITNNHGGTIVISGHSNTTPVLANLLLGKEAFAQFDDSDYGNLLIITVTSLGEGKLTHLRF